MNAPLLPEVLLRSVEQPQTDLPLATEGVLRSVWQSRYGSILIEVIDDTIFVNGQRVDPYLK
jgi:hypothetical protein